MSFLSALMQNVSRIVFIWLRKGDFSLDTIGSFLEIPEKWVCGREKRGYDSEKFHKKGNHRLQRPEML